MQNIKEKYSGVEIADYIVNKCIDDRVFITNLQLQRILYTLRDVINSEFEQWGFGNVIPEVYYRYSMFGAYEITMKIRCKGIHLSNSVKAYINPVVNRMRLLKPWEKYP